MVYYTFDLQYQQGKKMIVSDDIYRLHVEAYQDIHAVIPLNFLQHLNTVHITCFITQTEFNIFSHILL